MQTLMQDFRFSLRQIRRSPGFMVTAVLTLALGVGANTAIFSLLDQALLRSLPVRAPEQLVTLSATGDAWDGHSSNYGAGVEKSFSYPMYRDLRDRGTAFDGLIATAPAQIGIARDGASNLANAEIVSGNYFSVLGVPAAQGRLLSLTDDTTPGSNPVVVLSFNYWKTRLGADANAVGQTLSINGQPFQIIGVSAPAFQSAVWGQVPDVFVPMSMLDQVRPGQGHRLQNHKDRWMNIVGRLKEGETPEHAQVAMAPLWHALRAEELKALGARAGSKRFVDQFLTHSELQMLPGARGLSYSRDSLEKPLYAVMAMAFLVLLISAVNVASLLLVRSAARVREFSLRYALGANVRRVVQQLLLEGLLIGIAGGAAGLLIAPICIRVLVNRLDADTAMAFQTTLDGRLLAFNFAIAMLVSVLFSLAPAVQLLRPEIVNSLKQTSTAAGGTLSFRRLIVSLQVGLSILLLVGSGLFVRTMQNLRHVDTGFNISHLITFHIDPQLSGYAKEKIPALHQQVLDTVATLPSVQAVGATNDPELADTDHGINVTVEGYTPPPEEDFDVEAPWVNAGYFHAMQVPLLAGRTFSEDDDAIHPRVAIVNESFVKHYFSSPEAAVGRRVAEGGGSHLEYMTIVGVAQDTKHMDLRAPARPTFFTPLRQQKDAAQLYIYLRTTTLPEQSFAMVRKAIKQIDPGLAVDSMRTMDDQIETTLSNERMIELLAISFGLLATILAGVGLYGVLAYSTAQRTREIGIRIALGSTRIEISRLVLMDVLRLAGIGIVVAIPCSVMLGRLLRSQLFGVSTADPLTLGTVVLLVALVAVVAAILPARRASTVDPTTALRAE